MLRLCFLHQESQNQRNQLLLTRSHHPQPHPRGEVRPESLGWKIGRIKREGSKSQKKRTYRVQAQVSVVSSGAVPRLLARCSAPLGAESALDFGRLCWFLREMTVNPHYCSSCRSGPRIALLQLAAAALSARGRLGARTEPGYYRASGRSLPGGCSLPGRFFFLLFLLLFFSSS